MCPLSPLTVLGYNEVRTVPQPERGSPLASVCPIKDQPMKLSTCSSTGPLHLLAVHSHVLTAIHDVSSVT